MFGPKLKIEKSLYERLKKVARDQGYSSAEEFALHVLEKAVGTVEDSESEDEVRKRLRGLGYLE